MSHILSGVQHITIIINQPEMDALNGCHGVWPMLHQISQACLVSAN